jgi:SAM-dependent methyltransferase
MNPTQPNFNSIARPYRFLEYLTLGPTLQNCRIHFLPALLQQKSALILGDGDGRFLSKLLAAHPTLQADAVDASSSMLDLLQARCHAAYPTAHSIARLTTHHTDALSFVRALPPTRHYDLIVTHFFLDCLTQSELDALIETLTPHLQPGTLWLLSDFRVPAHGFARPIARTLIRSLYLIFRLLTGLRTTRLPDHATPLTIAGLTLTHRHHSLAGLLTTEIWRLPVASFTPPALPH